MACIVIRKKLFADIWRPEVSWSLRRATKALFQLARVVILSESRRISFSHEGDFLFCYRINSPGYRFVEHPGIQSCLAIVGHVEHKH